MATLSTQLFTIWRRNSIAGIFVQSKSSLRVISVVRLNNICSMRVYFSRISYYKEVLVWVPTVSFQRGVVTVCLTSIMEAPLTVVAT